jgi:hypothetical protein
MILEDFALVLRRRRPWEALDLGMVIVRRWRWVALRAWLATYGPFACACALLLFWDWRAAWLVLWWSKPLFDRVLLSVYSRSVFGSVPSLSESLVALRGFLATRQLWADLTYRRFSLRRSFTLCVTQLEGQSGAGRALRVNVLAQSISGCAAWLTLACGSFVLLGCITFVAAVRALAPLGVTWASWLGGPFAGRAPEWADAVFLFALLAVSETLFEPLYVASGFSLYLNRRSELEGWDLELAFRRMQQRLDGLRVGGPVVAILVAAVFIPWFSPNAVWALPVAVGEPGVGTSAVVVPLNKGLPPALDLAPEKARRIAQDPVFGHNEIEWVWMPRMDPATPRSDGSRWLPALMRLIARLSETLAGFGAWIVRILLFIALVCAFLYAAKKNWFMSATSPRSKSLPETLFGVDVRQDRLPVEVAETARRLLEEGNLAGSLGLLYRASLVALVHRVQVPFEDGDTEEGCLGRVQSWVTPVVLSYFGALIDAWRMTVYAHRPPPRERIAELCKDWSTYFGPEAVLEAHRP